MIIRKEIPRRPGGYRVAVLGLDMSMAKTGCFWQERDGTPRHRTLRTGPKDGRAKDRGEILQADLAGLLEEIGPVWICGVESKQFGYTDPGRAMAQAQNIIVRDMMMDALIEAGCLIINWAPASKTKFATGYGRATKKQVKQAVRKYWPECPNEDVADAVPMCCGVRQLLGFGHILPGRSWEQIQTIETMTLGVIEP